ncbi:MULTISPECIES: autotransporter outer membrane beta-barrel domain-containing protein [unclassified Bartonella]|uniref:autotransporter outer membrane beta-barrel domain-containing protein n=1 Tax=unclassified Bartonella TaxID=2645622 RepID=UPI0009C23E41|nr:MULTISPECIES: autotransporter outer membrane beta-barrel domain-containing protein [unclassified Bartonella]AQX28274.1 outer membrane autotransporter barrel domain-containing protein [Bartonella sp. JB15]AQX29545.1 outer membrane autotransporter barrel domain-containing protein [Bartonella sp. JB63]
MIKVFNNYWYIFATAIFCSVQSSVKSEPNQSSQCNENAEGGYTSIYKCSAAGKKTIQNKTFQTIIADGKDVDINGTNITLGSLDRMSEKTERKLYGVDVSKGGKVVLTQSVLKNLHIALHVSDGIIGMYNGAIEDSDMAVQALGKPTNVILVNPQIKTKDGKASFLSMNGASVEVKNGGMLDFTNSDAVYTALMGSVNFDGTTIIRKGGKEKQTNYAVFHIDQGGSIDFKNGNINVTGVHGLLLENTVATSNSIRLSQNLQKDIKVTKANIERSNIEVKGDKSYGIYFKGENLVARVKADEKADEEDLDMTAIEPGIRLVSLRNTNLTVLESPAIYSTDSEGSNVALSQSSISTGHLLLVAEKKSSVLVLADNSSLTGGIYVDDSSTAELYLSGNSVWFLTQTKQNYKELDLNNLFISVVSLDSSSINFKRLKSSETYDYRTLRIGKGTGDVYIARNNAQIHLNTSLSPDGSLDSQKTDRVLIHGNVSGKTTVDVRGISENRRGNTNNTNKNNFGNTQGISLIQVSGIAQQDSFKLKGGYITVNASPYRYKLSAYGPSSNLGSADPGQKLVGNNEKEENESNNDFWDYRLQSEYIALPPVEPVPPDSDVPSPSEPQHPKKPDTSEKVPVPPDPDIPSPSEPQHPKKPDTSEKKVPAIVPQLPSYLLLPHALFHADLVDMSNQHEFLEIMQNTINEPEKNIKPSFFIHGYGGNHRYASNLTVFEYGYGADLDYNAITAGVILSTLERKHSALSLGTIGTYGRLSLQPRAVKQSQKSIFNKWSGKFYAHLQYDTGFYANGFISYGSFKGAVSTLVRGKTATLKGALLSASLMGGRAIITNYDGFIIEPQLQVIYQSVIFDKAHDIDQFDIDLRKHDQWIARVGGRVTKALARGEEPCIVSFYSKLHLVHNYKRKQIVYFKDAFQLGAFGSTVEAGLGVHAQLLPNIVLHGDLLYKHKLTRAGFSGTSISAGLRYQF